MESLISHIKYKFLNKVKYAKAHIVNTHTNKGCTEEICIGNH